jgi:hypothetical protein
MNNDYQPLMPYEFKYRQIIYTGRNYEYMLYHQIKHFEKDIEIHELQNDFFTSSLEHHDPDVGHIKKIHHQFDLERKQTIDRIIRNGQLLNLYLIKDTYLTIEYLKLISWGYTPLNLSQIITLGAQQHDKRKTKK